MDSEAKLSHNKFVLSIVIFFSFVTSFTTCYFATPTVFGGRDQGSIATAAINLVKNKSFAFSTPVSQDLFRKYGHGKALNYPGFDYTKDGKLISRFPKAYIAYLAVFYTALDLKGIQYSNFIPLALFLVLFWLTLRGFFSEKISFLGYLVAATFFPFLWFAKYTLTEIFMLFLVWAGIYSLLVFRRNLITKSARIKQPLQFFGLAILFFALSALTRIEGMIFFLLVVAYMIILYRKKIIILPKNILKYLLISILFLFIFYIFLNFPALSDSLKNIAKIFFPNSTKDSNLSTSLYLYLARIFLIYNILPYLILGLAGIIWLGKNLKSSWLKSEFLPIFITFPAFFYLLSPQITLDDPWLLRRFAFAVFPVLIFYSIYFLNHFFYHKIFLYITLIALIAGNFIVSLKFLNLSENKNLLPQIERLSKKFDANDLVIIDRLASGSGYSLLSEPLSAIYGKNAVYFFNPDDLKYIRKDNYKNVYLVAPFSEKKSWYFDLIKEKSFDTTIITNNFLEPAEKKWSLAENIESEELVGIWKIK